MRIRGARGWTATAAILLGACGESTDAPTTTNAPTEPPLPPPAYQDVDMGAPSATYPAFQPDMPRLINKGGRVLTNPVVVTIAWSDNPNIRAYEELVDKIGATSYWRDVVSEYGVGPLTSGPDNHIGLTTPLELPADFENSDYVQPILDVLTKNLTDPATSKWPAPTDQSIYMFYLTGDTAMKYCQLGMGGMHDSTKINGKDVAYALVLDCEKGAPFASEGGPGVSISHELAEAASDPYPEIDPAWQGLDADHLAWELFQQGQDENGDMCELYAEQFVPLAPPELPHIVQRQWSNKSALAGHAPCVTASKEPYFNVTPLDAKDDLDADFGDFDAPFLSKRSKGLRVQVGETKTLTLGLYSDGATEPFELSAYEQDPFALEMGPNPSPAHNVELSLDREKGVNGEKAHLSVKVNQTTGTGVHLVIVEARLGNTLHPFPILVGGNAPDPAKRLDERGIPRDQLGKRTARPALAPAKITPRIRTFGLARR